MSAIEELRSMCSTYGLLKGDGIYTEIKEELKTGKRDGVFGLIQKLMAYNSNKIEGVGLTPEQTKLIYNTKIYDVDEIAYDRCSEIVLGHFTMINSVFKHAFNKDKLSLSLIKEFHECLMSLSFEFKINGGVPGEFKSKPNIVADVVTSSPFKVESDLNLLLKEFNFGFIDNIKDIVHFHVKFEKIHPFQDGNGRVGRALVLYMCVLNNLAPIVIMNENKTHYYNGFNDVDSMVKLFSKEQENLYNLIQFL